MTPRTANTPRSRRRIRWRTIFKWSGLTVCVLMVVVFGVSLRCTVGVTRFENYGFPPSRRILGADRGCLWYDGEMYSFPSTSATEYRWFVEHRGSAAMWWPQRYGAAANALIILPIWIPFTALAIPTAILFRLDYRTTRRARAGACIKCGYALTGLAPSSPCPQCGNFFSPGITSPKG